MSIKLLIRKLKRQKENTKVITEIAPARGSYHFWGWGTKERGWNYQSIGCPQSHGVETQTSEDVASATGVVVSCVEWGGAGVGVAMKLIWSVRKLQTRFNYNRKELLLLRSCASAVMLTGIGNRQENVLPSSIAFYSILVFPIGRA